jgi:hypothetical protein
MGDELMTVTDAFSVRAVPGELNYLAPESKVLRRFPAPGTSVNTGTYRSYMMPVHDGRPVRDKFTLDRNGFETVEHRSAVTDVTDPEEVDRVYVGEVADFVKSYTGADRVATLGWMLRRSAAPRDHNSQPHAALVHNDFSVVGARAGRGRGRDLAVFHVPQGIMVLAGSGSAH